MQAYMKSAMPYLGVSARPQAAVQRLVFKSDLRLSREDWVATVLELWRNAEYREERYAAIALTGRREYARFQDPQLLPVYEELVVSGAWWDYVDAVAVHRLGPILLRHPAELRPALLEWSISEDRWKRRTAIISQVAAGPALDWDLLVAAIEPNLADRDFFIRKAIGWALRQHARLEPDRVRHFVAATGGLSGLSRREALKHL